MVSDTNHLGFFAGRWWRCATTLFIRVQLVTHSHQLVAICYQLVALLNLTQLCYNNDATTFSALNLVYDGRAAFQIRGENNGNIHFAKQAAKREGRGIL